MPLWILSPEMVTTQMFPVPVRHWSHKFDTRMTALAPRGPVSAFVRSSALFGLLVSHRIRSLLNNMYDILKKKLSPPYSAIVSPYTGMEDTDAAAPRICPLLGESLMTLDHM